VWPEDELVLLDALVLVDEDVVLVDEVLLDELVWPEDELVLLDDDVVLLDEDVAPPEEEDVVPPEEEDVVPPEEEDVVLDALMLPPDPAVPDDDAPPPDEAASLEDAPPPPNEDAVVPLEDGAPPPPNEDAVVPLEDAAPPEPSEVPVWLGLALAQAATASAPTAQRGPELAERSKRSATAMAGEPPTRRYRFFGGDVEGGRADHRATPLTAPAGSPTLPAALEHVFRAF
jgi:hypothetical protein